MIKKISVLFVAIPMVILAAPSSPSDLRFSDVSSTSATLHWKDNAHNESGFKVYRNGKLIDFVKQNKKSYADEGLSPHTRYRYEVKASDDFVFELHGEIEKSSHVDIFIDADNDTATGYSDKGVIGADLLVENKKVFIRDTSNQSEWAWKEVGVSWNQLDNNHIFVGFDEHALGDVHIANDATFQAFNLSNDWTSKTALNIDKTNLNSVSVPQNIIGARAVKSTPVSRGTIIASVDGVGDTCSKNIPCQIRTAMSKARAGDVVFLREGTYVTDRTLRLQHSGEKDNPIIIESYPHENAHIRGATNSVEEVDPDWGKRVTGMQIDSAITYVHIRKLEFTHFGGLSVIVRGSHNLIEGCKVHDNFSAGIGLQGGEWHENSNAYVIPYPRGHNTVKDNWVYHNSDVGLHAGVGDGGNADGIWVGSGQKNRVIHNTVYINSDDGIDTWRSNDSYVAYNISHSNGLGGGDGNGFKAGGNWDAERDRPNFDAGNGRGATLEYNIAYNNKADGFEFNVGIDVIYRYNTSYNNGIYGFVGSQEARTVAEYNIALDNKRAQISKHWGIWETDRNSWNSDENVVFKSTDAHSKDFLVPRGDSPFLHMGARANRFNLEE